MKKFSLIQALTYYLTLNFSVVLYFLYSNRSYFKFYSTWPHINVAKIIEETIPTHLLHSTSFVMEQVAKACMLFWLFYCVPFQTHPTQLF